MKQFDDQNEFDQVFKSYKSIDVNNSDEKEMYSNIMLAINNSKKNKQISNFLMPVLSAIVMVVLLIPGGFFLYNHVILNEEIRQSSEYEVANPNNEEINILQQRINEEMDAEVYLPQFDDLDISFAYVSYNIDEEVRSVDVHYSINIAEDVVDHMEYPNINILYGPYNLDAVVIFSFDRIYEDINNVSGERVQVNEIEVVIQDDLGAEFFQYHMFVFNSYRYVIGYKSDYFTGEEALERTEEILYSIFN